MPAEVLEERKERVALVLQTKSLLLPGVAARQLVDDPSLADDEILSAIVVPAGAGGQGSAYVKFSHPASRYAVVGVAARVSVKNGTCGEARVALGGLLSHARRAAAVEKALSGKPATAASFEAAAGQVGTDLGKDVTGDLYASGEYRAAVAPIYVARALAAAASRAGGA